MIDTGFGGTDPAEAHITSLAAPSKPKTPGPCMEFDWLNPSFDVKQDVLPREVEESFEDPFNVRLVGNDENPAVQSRYFCLGKSSSGRAIFSVYRSDGKKIRIICARPMTENENYFYERKTAEQLG